METVEAWPEHVISLTLENEMRGDQSETAVERFPSDVSGSEGTMDGSARLRNRNETEIASDPSNDNGDSEAMHWVTVNPNLMNGGTVSVEIEYSKEMPANNGSYTICAKELTIEVNRCGNVIQGDNTTTTICNHEHHCYKCKPPSATSSFGAVVSDGPTNSSRPQTPSSFSKSDQGKQRQKRKPLRKKGRKESDIRISGDASKVRKRLYFGGLSTATTDLVRDLDSYGNHEDSAVKRFIGSWCRTAISYLLRECSEQENYEDVKGLLEKATEAIAEEDLVECIGNLMAVLRLSKDDLKEATVITTDVRFVLAQFYSIKNKPSLALEQLKLIKLSCCSEEQKSRILLKTGETSARIAQECAGEEARSSCEVMVEAEKHFEEALKNCSGKMMMTRQDQQAIKDACHMGMAKLLLRTDKPLTCEGSAPSKENLQKASEHIDHLEIRTVDFSPLMEAQYFLLKAYYQCFVSNYEYAHASAMKARELAEKWNFEGERKLATAAISFLSLKLPEKCGTDDNLRSFAGISSLEDWESSSADNEDSDPQDCDDKLNLSDSDSDF